MSSRGRRAIRDDDGDLKGQTRRSCVLFRQFRACEAATSAVTVASSGLCTIVRTISCLMACGPPVAARPPAAHPPAPGA